MLAEQILNALGLVATGAPVTGQFDLTGQRLSLRFEIDAPVGVTLLEITGTDTGGSQFTFENRPDEVAVADNGLFQLSGMHSDGSRAWELTASAHDEFAALRAIGSGGEPALLFVWTGLGVPDALDNDSLLVGVSVVLGTHDEVSRWRVVVLREQGASASIDRVVLPMLWLRAPVPARAGEDRVVAQRYTRLLIPTVLSTVTPQVNGNEVFWFWLLTAAERELVHPGTVQLYQFSALYAGDPQDVQSFGWMLYAGSEDKRGHHKAFAHKAVVNDADEPFYGWSAVWYPPFADWTQASDPIPTEFGNTFRADYPVVVGMLRAAADTFWYDACAYYRRFVETLALPALETNPRMSTSLAQHGYWFAFNTSNPSAVEPPQLYMYCLGLARAWRKALENPFVSSTPGFILLQLYRRDRRFGWPALPILDDLEAGVLDMVQAANADGFRVQGYIATLQQVEIGTGWDALVPPEGFWHDRDHQVMTAQSDGRDLLLLDAGAPQSWTFNREEAVQRFTQEVGFSGLYYDVFAGQGSRLAYDPALPVLPTHIAHGGDYWTQGMVSCIRQARDGLRELSPFGPDDAEAFLTSEGPQEYLAGELDATQDGYTWIPGHLLLAEEMLFGLLLPDVPDQARELSIPYWSLVYHAWAPMGRQTMLLTNLGLATNPDSHPHPEFPGLTAAEQVDLFTFVYYATFTSGLRPFLTYDTAVDSPLFTLQSDTLVVDEAKDAERTGLTIAGVLNDVYAAQDRDFAGQFMRYGHMQRPLAVDYRAADADLAMNPVAACRRTNPNFWWATFPVLYAPASVNEPSLASQMFPVPRVQHSVWRSPEGRLGILLAGWSGQTARLRGRFDPTLYDIPAGQSFELVELFQDGSIASFGTFAGPIDILTEDGVTVSGSEVRIGAMLPRTVRVLEIR